MITTLSYIIKVHTDVVFTFGAADNLNIFFGISLRHSLILSSPSEKLESEFSSRYCFDHLLDTCSSFGEAISHLDLGRNPL